MRRTVAGTIARATLAAALVVAASTAPLAAQSPVTLTFEGVATNAQGFLSTLPNQSGFAFENFGAYTSTTSFGTGSNASSGIRFAYAYAVDESYVYRADNLNFTFLSAALSFRTFDGNVSPAQLVVNGYRTGAAPVFTRTLSLTNSAQLFTFDWANVNELEFVTTALDANRSAVLAVDDLTLATVPEPGSIVLVATGLGVVALAGARRKQRQG
jgi:hypothetical protein